MEHERAQELLSDYQEGTLAEAERAALDAHLGECGICREDLSMLQQAMQMVRRLPRVEAPDHFARRVHRRALKDGLLGRKRLQSRLQPPHVFSFTTVMLLAAVAALILFVLIVQQQIQLLVVPPGPAQIEVAADQKLSALAELAWRHGGSVRAGGADLAAPGPLPDCDSLELLIPAQAFGAFSADLARLGPGLSPDAPPPDERGRIRVRIVRRGFSDAGSSGSKAP